MTDTWDDLAADLDDAGQAEFAARVRRLSGEKS